MRRIGDYAINRCSSLTTIKFEHTSSDSISISSTYAFYATSTIYTTIYCNLNGTSPVVSGIRNYGWSGQNRSVTYKQI